MQETNKAKDDLASSTGTVLFGGIDSDKYSGDLIAVPIIKDSSAKNYTSFQVTLSSVASVYTSNSSLVTNYTSSLPLAVILDSGTTLTYLPTAIATKLISEFGATYDSSLGYATVDCSLANGLSIEYQFGGFGGPIITVPVDELIISEGSTMTFGPGGGQGSGTSSTSSCAFGISESDDTFLLGDSFLRSAYAVYDLDAKQVALAQAKYNSTTTSITAITSGSTVPLVSSTATAVVATSTGTVSSNEKSGAMGMAVASLLPVAFGTVAGALLIFV